MSSSSDLHSSRFQPPTTLTTDKVPLLHSPMAPNRSKTVSSYACFIRKFLFFTFFIVSLPMFPSRAPDFFDKTILTQFWELLHLIFIGVAVAYGLFSTRRNLEIESTETELHSNLYDSQSYGSSLFNNSSYFNGECDNNPYGYFGGEINNGYAKFGNFENENGYVDQNVVQTWNSRYYQGQSVVMVADGNCVVDEFNSMPRSMMTASVSPLGLPVRNLKTSPAESHELSGVSESDSSSDDSRNGELGDFGIVEENVPVPSTIQRRSRSVKMGIRENDARGPSHFRPLSVDKIQFEGLKSRSFKYTESDPLSGGNSMKTEIAENRHFAAEQQPLIFSHLAVDETQVESLSDSFRAGSFSSQDSSPSKLSPLRSTSSESQNSNTEDIRKRKNSRKLRPPPNSSSSSATMNNSDSLELSNFSNMENVRRPKSFQQSYSYPTMNNKVPPREEAGGSTHHRRLHFKPLSDDDTRFDPLQSQSSSSSPSSQCSETSYSPIRLSPEPPNSKAEELREENTSRRKSAPLHSRHYSMLDTDMHQSCEDELSKDFNGGEYQKLGSRSLKWDSSSAKALPRGRSVRTIRPDKYRNHVKNIGEKTYHGVLQAGYSSNESGGIENLSFGLSDQKLESLSIIRSCQTREKDEHSKNSNAAGSKENSETESDTFDTNFDELETVSNGASESGQGPNEVDKKAGEFIAKFREQIRLQKVSSFDSTQGHNIRNSIFR